MTQNTRITVLISCLIAFSLLSYGQEIIITQSNIGGIYESGENIELSFELKGIDTDSVHIKLIINNLIEIKSETIPYQGGRVSVMNDSFDEPLSLILEVETGDYFASTGLVVDPQNFVPGTERPKDFKSYWKMEKKALRSLPMKVISTALSDIEEGYLCADLEINCSGPKPARGYFAKPEGAVQGSLPIVLVVHAAGVKGSWCLSKPENALRYAKMGSGALCFDLNAHGMLNGQEQSYYDELEEGELKNYPYQGIYSREDFYFRGMYLRLIRTLDFLCEQTEWDGKRIIVIGESQGGGQALAAAGLDKRVTAAVATVPAMCDWGGIFADRKGGWPQVFNVDPENPELMETLPYFDAAHLLKDSKASLFTEIGLIDQTCPASSIYAAINQSKGKKIIFAVPYRGHHLKQTAFQEEWENSVYKPRMAFIADFLK